MQFFRRGKPRARLVVLDGHDERSKGLPAAPAGTTQFVLAIEQLAADARTTGVTTIPRQQHRYLSRCVQSFGMPTVTMADGGETSLLTFNVSALELARAAAAEIMSLQGRAR